jgi:hypothetical protein
MEIFLSLKNKTARGTMRQTTFCKLSSLQGQSGKDKINQLEKCVTQRKENC